ncbi:tryptophanase [candidate division KSB1 bacterium]
MYKHEPYKIKSVRHLDFYSLSERKNFLRESAFNVGRIPVSLVTFDAGTQGMSAMSQEQAGALFRGDEAYAGARNFNSLTDAVREVFDFNYVCPVHNRHGGIKLLCSIYVRKGCAAAGNVPYIKEVVEYFGGSYTHLPYKGNGSDSGDIDTGALESSLRDNDGRVSFIFIDLYGNGRPVISKENTAEVRRLADTYKVELVLDVSCIPEYVYRLMGTEGGEKSFGPEIKKVSAFGHTLLLDAGQGAMSNVGGFLASNNPKTHEHHQNEVVVFEGLHTYGGMAGRTMEVVAIGLREMADFHCADWNSYQVELLAGALDKASVPFKKGYNGIYLDTEKFISGITGCKAHTLAAALYLTSGIRAHLDGSYSDPALLPVLIPRRALLNTHIREIAHAIIHLYRDKDTITLLTLNNTPKYHYEAEFNWLVPGLEEYVFSCEPYTAHAIEHIGITNRESRINSMKEAGYNTFLLMSEDVTIDLLTDSGTNAMSIDQWLAYLDAQESPSTPDSYFDIVSAAQEIYGYKDIILTHQGRAAEHIMSQMFIQPGDYVPGNMYFTTTKLHQEIAGGIFVDVIVDEAHDTKSDFPWKGNIDLKKLSDLYERAQKEQKEIAYISFEFNVNMAGGQPVSMENIKEVYNFCKPRNIPVFFDATRCTENARFIQMKDPYYSDTPIGDILLEMFSYGDGATISSKKDMLTNLSGMLIFRDNEEWYNEAQRMLQLFEGPSCSGGTSAGDMAAHAQGLYEMIDDDYIESRVSQVEYLGTLLKNAGVPIVLPPGGHAIFLDARAFLEHIDQDMFPAQMLASQLYIETGVRGMERGNVSKGRNPETGENYRPSLELVRLTIPRRVYSNDHMKCVAEGIIQLYKNRKKIKGLEFIYEPEKLRFFQARFKEID